jgi:hypothetical protein
MKDKHAPPNHELELHPAPEDIMETCLDCGVEFEPDGETNYLGSWSRKDFECSPQTPLAAYCSECYEKRTQAWDQQKDAYEESGTL